MDNFLKWKNEDAYSPRGVMFDCGNTVHAALRAYEKDNGNPFTGSTDPMSAGNGGLMRLASAIIAGRYRDEAVYFAKETTRLTHGADEALKYCEALTEEFWEQGSLSDHADLKHPTNIDRHQVMSGVVLVKQRGGASKLQTALRIAFSRQSTVAMIATPLVLWRE